MTDKERLEDINNFSSLPLKKRISLTKESIKKELKANDYHMPKNININTQYLLEIIEQAERVQELESRIADDEHFVVEILEQNKRYREALEFYANKINYLTFIENGKSNIEHDQGEKARKALEGSG